MFHYVNPKLKICNYKLTTYVRITCTRLCPTLPLICEIFPSSIELGQDYLLIEHYSSVRGGIIEGMEGPPKNYPKVSKSDQLNIKKDNNFPSI